MSFGMKNNFAFLDSESREDSPQQRIHLQKKKTFLRAKASLETSAEKKEQKNLREDLEPRLKFALLYEISQL